MRYVLALIVACSLVIGMGCGERPAPPPPPPPAKPTSSWTDADSAAVAKELMGDATRHPWIAEYRNRLNRLPRVVMGEIVDKSGDHVDVSGFAAELERCLASSLQVGVVRNADAADVVLDGTINRENGKQASYFQIDLRLEPQDHGDTAWHGSIERQVQLTPR
ncbi:MAG: hypothetical protein H0W83_08010 [Planctomycetes bacterium]|nr:hypothetical protein [Planctomycetota bacterium]